MQNKGCFFHVSLVFVLMTTLLLSSIHIAAAQPGADPRGGITFESAADFEPGDFTNTEIELDGGVTLGNDDLNSPAYQPFDRFGIYISQEKQVQDGFNELAISYLAVTADRSDVEVEIRASADGSRWTGWQPVKNGGSIELAQTAQFFQFRATLLALADASKPVLQSVTVTPANVPVPSGQGISLEPMASATYRLYATREGLVGGTTANGHIITERDHFVALPSRVGLASNWGHEYEVMISYKGKTAIEPVWDVGPWNIKDNYWDQNREIYAYLPPGLPPLPLGKPEAHAAKFEGYNGGKDQFGRLTNGAGIDLADGTFWDDLGMIGSDWVDVTFLWKEGGQPGPSPTPTPTPTPTPSPPPTGSILIDNGNAVAHKPQVNIYLSYQNATEVRFSNDNKSSWSKWYRVASTISWTLSGVNGPKTVYAQFRNSSGTLSAVTSDSITLDYTIPTGTIVINNGAASTNAITAIVSFTAYDPDGIKDMRVGNMGGGGVVQWGSWRPFTGSLEWRLMDGPDAGRAVCVQYRDVWGIKSQVYTDSIKFKRQAPALLTPVQDHTVNKLIPTLDWGDVSYAKGYKVVVKDVATGQIIIQNATTDSFFKIPEGKLRPGRTYAWWTKALLWGYYSEKSAKRQFIVTNFQPSLTSPSSGSPTGLTPTLDWEDVMWADRYEVKIQNAKTSVLIHSAKVTDSTYAVPAGVLKPGKTYTWKVLARSSAQWGAPSVKWEFSTQ